MKPLDYLGFYATKFNTVEIDSTYYGTPKPEMVARWRSVTPENFIFAAKVPSAITHDKCLVDCDAEFTEFVSRMDLLGPERLGPLVLQFPFFNSAAFRSDTEFIERLVPFLEKLPADHKFALEIRNKYWLNERFADLLRAQNVALALQDQAWMPMPGAMKFDYVTAPFSYVRLLGDRKEIEAVTRTWDKVVVDRSKQIPVWTDVCQKIMRRGVDTFVYVNNHYSGYAPATVAEFIAAL